MPSVRELANAIRFLSIDAIQKANSGHPGMPLGMADIATVLWQDFLHHNPRNPEWPNRDRFIISNGHGSMLQYALLHLTGYELTIDDIKQFRQLHSKTPGHPERGLTPGVEITTGPLGQGLANAVGMALAEKILASTFNRPGFNIVDHFTYVFVGDGCLMEGLSHEVCSLAGTHALGKLIVFWDDNEISIDGNVKGWFTDDTKERFLSYGWHTVSVDGHDPKAIFQAISEAKSVNNRPSIICCKTVIGFGAPNLCGSHDCHGSPLGEEEIEKTRVNLNWPHPPLFIPKEIYQFWDARQRGEEREEKWRSLFAKYVKKYPNLAEEFLRRINRILPDVFAEKAKESLLKINEEFRNIATRQASQDCLNIFGPLLPELFGGSADLTPSNLTSWSLSRDVTVTETTGNYLHYGVREFAMFTIMNGFALYSGFIPYGGTFLVFISYGHSAIRMSAMMKQRVIYVLTHDSIGLGEDGPTHQPIEQLTMLRATPGLSLWRPADRVETLVAWQAAIERSEGPTCLVLSRQKLTQQERSIAVLNRIKLGGYILIDSSETPECIVIATGSEVEIAVKAVLKLNSEGKRVRLVSMPSCDVFDRQDDEYKEKVLPRNVKKRVAIEAATSFFWYKYVGEEGVVMGIDRYGESAPAKEIFALLGLTEENIIQNVLQLLET